MMKLFSEEKTGLKIGLNKLKLILLLFFIQAAILPQVPIKGFCKLNSFITSPGYNNLLSLNFDNNEYSDLLIFSPQKKSAILFYGKTGNSFDYEKSINLPVELSDLEPIIEPNNMIENYAFSSRKGRSFGIMEFTKDGNASIKKEIKFDYYPQNISYWYNKSILEFEFILSGSSFNGISLISEREGKLFEKKITDKTVFNDAHFIDFNSDGYDDIIALNAIENKLHFFFRNSKNDFEDLRQISFNNDIIYLQVFDINYDGYKDIIVSLSNGIEIYFGDPMAAYNKSTHIVTLYQPDKFVYGDYNRDGYFDINYINKLHGIISTIFAKSFNSFYAELVQKSEMGLIDVIPFYSKFIYGVASLSTKGKVNIISKINSLSENQKLAIAVQPGILKTFDYLKDDIIDFAFTNEQNNTLNIIIRDAAGVLATLFTIDLFELHNNLKIFSLTKNLICFVFFSEDKRSIEVLEADLKSFTFNRKFYYAKGKIIDVLVKNDYKNFSEVLILYSENGKLGLKVETKMDETYFTKVYPHLEKNWIDAFIISGYDKSIGYIQKNKKSFLVKTLNAPQKKYNIKISRNVEQDIFDLTGSIFTEPKTGKTKYCAFLTSLESFIITADEKLFKQVKSNANINLRITNKNQLFFGKDNSIFVADKIAKTFYKISSNDKTQNFMIKKIFDDIDAKSFSVEKFEPRKENLIYTCNDGTIEIRQLPK